MSVCTTWPSFFEKKMSFTEHYIYPNNVFYTDFTHKNYFGNVFSAHFPIWGREIEELDRLRLALNIWRHFRKLPSAETRKNFKGVLFSFCGEEKYNTEVAVKSTKTMKNSGHLTFLLTQQVWPEKTADIWRRYKWFPHQKTSGKRAQKLHTDNTSLFNVPTQILVVLLIGRAVWEIYFNQSEALPRSG